MSFKHADFTSTVIDVDIIDKKPNDRANETRTSDMIAAEVVRKASESFQQGITKPYKFRIAQLKGLLKFYKENENEIVQALNKDLRRSRQETLAAEIWCVTNEIECHIRNLKSWMKPINPGKDLLNIMDTVRIYNEPYGVALVIGSWNYPLYVTLLPMSAAIAAGNCVVLKPSELATHSAALLERLLPKYLDQNCYFVFNGGIEETTSILEQKFDYIFFTGSANIGKIVHKAANKNLTPVTLELGGQSPVYIDESVNMETVVKRILWGKFLNAGQTCIAPNHIYCSRSVADQFLKHADKILKEWFGSSARNSPDYCRIISEKHFKRLIELSKDLNISIGGHYDADDRYIEPTIVADAKLTDPIMKEEIFGPILPIVYVNGVKEAIRLINLLEKPLAMYIFSNNQKDVELILENTSCGGVTVNDTLMHTAVETLPFGGVGLSGMGSYHGKYSFDTFTHKKPCLKKSLNGFGEKLLEGRYPPYSNFKENYLKFMMTLRYPSFCKYIKPLLGFGSGVCVGVLVQMLYISTMED